MKITVRGWRLALRVLALAVAIAVVPVPLLAQEKSPPAAQPGIRASLHKVVTANPVVPTRVQATRTQGSTATPPQSSFFKTPAGIAVLAVIGAGTGYALYSSKHDRIHSEVRAGQ